MRFNADGIPVSPGYRSLLQWTDVTAAPSGRAYLIRWRADTDLQYEISSAGKICLVARTMREALQWVASQ